MRKNIFLLIVLFAMLAIAVPAAARHAEPIGSRINLLATPDASITFPSGEPFHIMHGWALNPRETRPVGKFDFQLEVDGVAQECPRTMERTRGSSTPLQVWRVCNYPGGMTGTHTFFGTWLGPCGWAADNGYPVTCAGGRNESVVLFTDTLEVEFTSSP